MPPDDSNSAFEETQLSTGHSSPGGSPSDAPSAPARFEHFEVLRRPDGSHWELGRGAMGITYKAFDTRLQNHVALKVISANLLSSHPFARERFLREARAAARLRHPNVATVYHLGETSAGAQAFYAMEFIEGETLAERVSRVGPVPVWLALEIGVDVACALAAAGQQGLIHRDLKPANLMLTARVSESGTPAAGGSRFQMGEVCVKLIDFGLAKATANTGPLTGASDFLGTPQFASPEQFGQGGEEIDARTDIYSLGVTLWYALTGKVPFVGKTLSELHSRKASQSLPVAQLDTVQVPAPLAELLASMLAADPADRPQTPHALLDSLRRCRAALDPSTPADAWVAAARPRSARARRLRSAVGLGLALLAAAVAGIWFVRARLAPARAAEAARLPDSFGAGGLALPAPEKSVAVLPFESLSDDKSNAYFADGIQDEILTDLAKLADLKVISRTSVIAYKSGAPRNLREIAAQLGIAHVLEGSVQRAGNQVRVHVRLIDARTDAQLWAEHYDRSLDDVFAIQSDIAQAIANQLRARLSTQERSEMNTPPSSDFEAFDLYLHARNLFGTSTASANARENNARAVNILQAALARDPKFVLAWCLLARVHCTFYFTGLDHTAARLEQARSAVRSALDLQPDSGDAHLALADYYYHGFRDFEHALAEMDIARRTLPNSAEVYEYSGYIDRRQGRWADATRNLERALELDPRNFYLLQQMGITYLSLHRFDDEARAIDRALSVDPTDAYTRILRSLVDLDARADIKPFQATLARLLKADPSLGPDIDDPSVALCERTREAAARSLDHFPREGAANNGVVTPHAYWEGVIARWEGDGPRAKAAFATARTEVEKVVAAQPDLAAAVSLLGVIDAGLGRKAEAIAEGRRACLLLPIGKDGIDGPIIADNLAQIYAWTGEKRAAVEQLRAIERVPNVDTYGCLKLHPIYDDLRGDSGFEALVASLAPK